MHVSGQHEILHEGKHLFVFFGTTAFQGSERCSPDVAPAVQGRGQAVHTHAVADGRQCEEGTPERPELCRAPGRQAWAVALVFVRPGLSQVEARLERKVCRIPSACESRLAGR